ncbi:hypothetical protein BDZ97DRAFT_1761929 [Flammula alnicola]|nr:hypothetical protein BDZ97DRAFT_1761929 [Flammula alnicola]
MSTTTPSLKLATPTYAIALSALVKKVVQSYFTAAKPSAEQRIYSVLMPMISSEKVGEPRALMDAAKLSYYSSAFSPGTGFYVLSYLGLSTPWTKVVDTDRPEFEFVLETNDQLNNMTQEGDSCAFDVCERWLWCA